MNRPISLLFRLALRVSPVDRAVWFEAMRTELEFMPRSQRLRFASGCLAAAVVWRVWTPEGVRTLTQGALVAASGSLAALIAVHVLLGTFGHLGLIMTGLALAYASGAAVTARWGVRGMALFALGGIALDTAVMSAWAGGFAQPTAFARALSLEACLILATFLGAAAVAQALANRLERLA